jgi:hypothetical protein
MQKVSLNHYKMIILKNFFDSIVIVPLKIIVDNIYNLLSHSATSGVAVSRA